MYVYRDLKRFSGEGSSEWAISLCRLPLFLEFNTLHQVLNFISHCSIPDCLTGSGINGSHSISGTVVNSLNSGAVKANGSVISVAASTT